MWKRAIHPAQSLFWILILALFAVFANDGSLQLNSRSIAVFSPEMMITSTAFDNEGTMPIKYTCEGEDISPPLEFINVPKIASSLALVMEDPDAPGGIFVHWIVWNIPPNTTSLYEGKKPAGVEGRNDFGETGYGGPCPPRGVHRYFFRLYALDTLLDLPQDSTVEMLKDAMMEHTLAEAVLMARYSRRVKPTLLTIVFAILIVLSVILLLMVTRRHSRVKEFDT